VARRLRLRDGAHARVRSSRRLSIVALLIVGCGLWWPGHFLEPGDASSGGIPLIAAALALALAGLAGATAVVTTRKTLPAFAGLALLTLGVAYAHSLFATPGLFRASAAIGSWGPAGAILALAATLVGIALDFQPTRKVQGARFVGAAGRRPHPDAVVAGAGGSRRDAAAAVDRGPAPRRPRHDRRGAARGARRAVGARGRAVAARRGDRRGCRWSTA
jgi:hypothetical protein